MTLASYLAPTRQTIWLKGRPEHYHEDPAGAAGIKPGHLLEFYNNAGTRTVRVYSTPGGRTPVMVAIEDSLQGYTITDAYASGDPVRYIICETGDEIQARVPAGAPAIVIGDRLSMDGTGCLVKTQFTSSGSLYSSVAASAAVTNTVTATAFDKSYTIPANTLAVGDIIRIRGQGIATATNSTDTLAVDIKIGSTTILTIPATDVANNDIFVFDVTVIVRTIGASGTFVALASYNIGVPGTATTRTQSKASTAIDTTAAQAITVVATWSVANAGNSVRLDLLEVELGRTGAAQGFVAMATKALDNSAGVAEAFTDVLVA